MTTVETPWDTSPPSDAQLHYLNETLIRLGIVDWSQRDTTMMSEALSGLNKARKAAGLGYEPI